MSLSGLEIPIISLFIKHSINVYITNALLTAASQSIQWIRTTTHSLRR